MGDIADMHREQMCDYDYATECGVSMRFPDLPHSGSIYRGRETQSMSIGREAEQDGAFERVEAMARYDDLLGYLRRRIWVTTEGKEIAFDDISDSHLDNIIAKCEREGLAEIRDIMVELRDSREAKDDATLGAWWEHINRKGE